MSQYLAFCVLCEEVHERKDIAQDCPHCRTPDGLRSLDSLSETEGRYLLTRGLITQKDLDYGKPKAVRV